ncbi:receptor-interacting serine/threonine-protein kinase 3-like isoform X2 [Mastacembelus armatus]|uniref:receptor-interacting serine/threonine-protein kinase 3-like isoform X2 n=1 Tax=Mastacembelus armatus TaxID=205130 RepID=UPI000E45DEEF|nr:receptor-interacting serine/threonine-protein kinase 3-like isoform X2 [Mastacembelus armatus]
MALQSRLTERIGSESLENWKSVGSGGFGQVYKAMHKGWGFDVAIKILRDDVGSAVFEEANLMNEASCEFVLRVYGIFEGVLPDGGTLKQKGIVMDFMQRGSVQDLQKDLSGPPPWPLAFRLAHQVAVGMNFLHSKKLMHSDLKPSNVLLTDDFNAKLADFGFSRVSTSALNCNTETTEVAGGSFKYMPPEAFDISYRPVRSFDIYSYGILLWSVFSGEEPYPNNQAVYSLVKVKVCEGNRPSCKEIVQRKADGLEEMVDLMERCWDGDPSKRPRFKDCLEVTGNVFTKHKKHINAAVNEVLKRLESPTWNDHPSTSGAFSQIYQTPEQPRSHDTVDHIRRPERFSVETMSDEDKAKFIDNNKAELIKSVSEVMAIVDKLGNMVQSETYSVIKAQRTSQDKVRVLLQRTLHSGGAKVKAAFYDILKTDQPHLVERLGG